GAFAQVQRDWQTAQALLDECVALRRELGDRRGLAASLNVMANFLNQAGDPTSAHGLAEESLTIRREIGDRWGTVQVLGTLVNLTLRQGDKGLARVLAQEYLDTARPFGGPLVASGLNFVAVVALEEGEAEAAAKLCRDALATSNVDRITAHSLLETM